MSYNGFADQDAFHAAMQARWAEMLSTPEGRERHRRAYGPGNTSHAACDHANDYCCQARDGHFTPSRGIA